MFRLFTKIIFRITTVEYKGKDHPATGRGGSRGSGSVKAPDFFVTFGTTRVVGLQPYAPAVFTSGEINGTHFQRLNRAQGTLFRRSHGKNLQGHHRESIPGPAD